MPIRRRNLVATLLVGLAVFGLSVTAPSTLWAQDVPEVVRGLLEQAERHQEAGRAAEAEASYREAIRLGPEVVEPYLALGALRLGAGDLEGSLEVFEDGLAQGGNRPDARLAFNAAVVAWRLQRFDTTLQHVDTALVGSRNDPDLHALRSAALAGLGEHEQALDAIERALSRRKNDPQLLLRKGNLLHTLGRLDDAITAFSKAIQRDPDLLQASYNLGAVLFELERYEDARAAYGRALVPIEQAFSRGEPVDPIHARAFANLGAIHVHDAMWTSALDAYEKALRLDPEMVTALYNRGYSHYQLGQFPEAYEAYVAALARNPELPLAYLHLAKIHRRRGECSAAISRLETGLPKLDAVSQPEGLRTLADCQLELGDRSGAEANYRRLLELDADDPVTLVALGRLLRRDDRRDEAEALLTQAHAQLPDDDRVTLELASLARARGDRVREQSLYEMILARGGGRYELPVRLRLTLFLLRQGEVDAARPHLERLVAKIDDPEVTASAEERGLVATLHGLAQVRDGEVEAGSAALRAAAETNGFEPAARALELVEAQRGAVDGALAHLDQVGPGQAADHANRGQLLWLAGRGEAARSDLEAAVAELQDWPSLHAALGDLDARAGRWAPAAERLQRARALCQGASAAPSPETDGRFEAHLDGDHRALCDWIAGRWAEVSVVAALNDLTAGRGRARRARQRADEALASGALDAATTAAAHYVRGTAALIGGNLERARRDLASALEGPLEASLRPLAQTNLGVAMAQQGQTAEARRFFEEARTSSAPPAAASLGLGILLEQELGEPRQAIELYEGYLTRPGARRTAEVGRWLEQLRRLYP